ncbi:MAG: EscU/YscU/HrcU family type III secretion system export apparatus switch protein [Thermoguttaceae bacterium]|nr:EscU/YscU/HrcU family type III secretion system export apparatus switch protein [Thermoguttaceae bacterium]MBR4102643.1 EscU/YscU/HrcU family type III secretion system export apparatus switch protein [Thermoguttaceae bacterium]
MSSENERVEQATPKKKLDARKKGNVAKSQDAVAAVALTGAVVFLAATARSRSTFLLDFWTATFSRPFALSPDAATLTTQFSETVFLFLRQFAIFGAVVVFCSVAANLLQSGFLLLPNKLAPDFNRLNPIKGFQRLFSGESTAQIFFGIVKIVCVVALVGAAFWRDRETLANVGAGSVAAIAAFFFEFLVRLALQLCAALVLFAVGDYAWRRFRWERELRMTRQELQEEMREEVGDPQIKSKRRQIQRDRRDSAQP